MKLLLTSLAYRIQEFVVRPHVRAAITSLEATGDHTAILLAESIRDTFHGSLSTEEQRRIGTIEALRKQLHLSNEKITIVDFGAHADPENGTIVHRTIGDVAVSSSKPYRWSLLLFYIVQKFTPKHCLEFGTCLGISTLYQAAALALNNNGDLITMEGAPALAEAAQKHFTELGYSSITSLVGKFDDVLPSVIKHYEMFDYVFIDGHHEEHATFRYFEQLLPSLMHNAVVIFDDIHWSSGMKRAWKKIIAHPRVKYSADLYQVGIVIVS